MDREELEQRADAAGYGSAKNVKHVEMEDFLINFLYATAVEGADFINLTTTNGNLFTPFRQQEDHIQALQAKLFNLKVAAATRPVNMKTNKTGHLYTQNKNQNHSGQGIRGRRSITTEITGGCTDTTQATHTRQKHVRGKKLVTGSIPRE